MKVKALVAFAGEVCMATDEVKDVPDAIGKDLIDAGYAVSAESAKAKTADKTPGKGKKSADD